ncbi:lysin A [Mycobacterium phage 40AC]|uniref:Lysin A n=1 Tax=Mycobacterium phage 40AC TaxID=1458717 RepID=W8EG98_9CAUD|nr:endolysin [Mycobacterium phage 40AC]AHJ86376.1 lysin A [Mycobacterium phage 40AC]
MTFVVTRERAQWVHDMARARNGLPYAYGGAFTNDPKRSTDCSGLVLQTAAWYGGRTDWVGNRYGSTESFRLNHKIVFDLGFKRLPPGGVAALGFTPVMLVGLQHGGGGMYSHTACTLMTMDIPGGPVKVSKRGVDWESHGNRAGGIGVDLYDYARAWNDPLFHDFWYLDAKLEDSVSTGVDKAEILSRATGLSIDRARVLYPAVRDGLIQSDCTTPRRIAAWLAEIGHESVSFEYTEEIAKNGRYAPYIGRTWVQITWDYNYRDFSAWCFERGLVPTPDYFVVNYRELADTKWAGIGAAWYWTEQRPMNALVDAGDGATWRIGDITYRGLDAVTAAINGGLNGKPDRRRRFDLAMALGDQLLELISEEDDFLSALSNDEQRELLNLMRWVAAPEYGELRKLFQNEDMYRENNNRRRTAVGVALDARTFGWEDRVEKSAERGEMWAIDLVVRAARGTLAGVIRPGGNTPDPFLVNHAKQVLADVERINPEALKAYIAANGAR